MRAIFLTTVFATLVFTANVDAKNVKYTNHSEFEKEYITVNEDTSEPVMKEYYSYNEAGRAVEKTISKWVDGEGWIESKKYEYNYNGTGNLSDVTYTERENKKCKSYFLQYIYDENNELLTVTQVEVDNNTTDNYFTQK